MQIVSSSFATERVLGAGERAVFGRSGGVNDFAISADGRVSEKHGAIKNHGDSWSVQSIGSTVGFVVFDAHSPSRLVVPRGAGPLSVPFHSAVLSVQISGESFNVNIHDAPGSSGWGMDWSHGDPSDNGTRPAWNTSHWFNRRTGKPLQWYRLLVALCAPRLQTPPDDMIPTNDQLAARLGFSKASVDKNLHTLYDRLGLAGSYDTRVRLTAITIALHQGIVKPSDLAVLDLVVDASLADDD